MRDKNRIPKVLKEIEEIWKQHPELRLGQLILNITDDTQLYYAEDSRLIDELKDFYGERSD